MTSPNFAIFTLLLCGCASRPPPTTGQESEANENVTQEQIPPGISCEWKHPDLKMEEVLQAKETTVKALFESPLLEGTEVRVRGYLHLEFEGDAMYHSPNGYQESRFVPNPIPHKEIDSVLNKAIYVIIPGDVSIRLYNDLEVWLTATVTYKSHGHMGLFVGELRNIRHIKSTNRK